MYCVFLGRAVATNAPGAGSVNTAAIANNAVTGAKLSQPFNYDSGTFYLDDTNNRVGIGTTSPNAELEIKADTPEIRIDSTGASGRNYKIHSDGDELYLEGIGSSGSLKIGEDGTYGVSIDLGTGGIQLSDGIYIGGTGTANKLDDYEEGSWTPTSFSSGYTASSASGTYTKIGDTVFIRALLNFSAVNSSSNSKCNFDGLPFSASHSTSGVSREDSTTGAIFVVRLGSGTAGEINSMDGISNGSNSVLATGRNYRISGFYIV
jgi:hypothetical protein